ncbi:hypothetical protein [Sporichthya sp.]|uniref:hypothetical protein n=1 Tax=Sporichthya sp. TaxID=65475 RepID=UPI0017A0B8AC|nr:hypothetical protein [Sporichthya sp.]MBA3745360.1 hypothetical protein [Sporichthya sp.]
MYVVYAVLAVLGAVLFFIGTGMVGNETVYDDQVPGINLAIVGVVLANAAGVLLLLAGRRSVTTRRVAVLGAVPVAQEKVATITAPASSAHLVGGEGLTHFHRADCAMAAGREWPELDRSAHERAGRTACGVCKP